MGTIVRHAITHRPKKGGPRKYPLPKIGDRYGELTVTGYVVGEDGYPHAQDRAILVQCSCGSPEYATKSNWLDNGHLSGCRCCARSRANARNAEIVGYQQFFPDLKTTRSYVSRLEGVRRRCYSPTDERYPDYGGRGIRCWWHEQYGKDAKRNSKTEKSVWKREMLSYLSTLEGWGDYSLQIDRIDVNGDYAPGNIRLVSSADNTRTRRKVRTVHAAALAIEQENAALKRRIRQLEEEVALLRVGKMAIQRENNHAISN
jgi:hypothetical protein